MKKTEKTQVEFDYKTIKSFEDACAKCGMDPTALPEVSKLPADIGKMLIACHKLVIIFLAINNGWKPDWSNWNQYKYFPWFEVLSSGFGFSGSVYLCGHTRTGVGSRLCTDTSEKALYVAEQFKDLYRDYLLYTE
ncbi:MAG TPA: hypothetical protein VK207_08920 [Bacteroidales bacterium]|nr:hypothetical protein [Bacteroidales bacterium]